MRLVRPGGYLVFDHFNWQRFVGVEWFPWDLFYNLIPMTRQWIAETDLPLTELRLPGPQPAMVAHTSITLTRKCGVPSHQNPRNVSPRAQRRSTANVGRPTRSAKRHVCATWFLRFVSNATFRRSTGVPGYPREPGSI